MIRNITEQSNMELHTKYKTVNSRHQQIVVIPTCFRGMYLQAKRAILEENRNV